MDTHGPADDDYTEDDDYEYDYDGTIIVCGEMQVVIGLGVLVCWEPQGHLPKNIHCTDEGVTFLTPHYHSTQDMDGIVTSWSAMTQLKPRKY